jgi:hypothetical protein
LIVLSAQVEKGGGIISAQQAEWTDNFEKGCEISERKRESTTRIIFGNRLSRPSGLEKHF